MKNSSHKSGSLPALAVGTGLSLLHFTTLSAQEPLQVKLVDAPPVTTQTVGELPQFADSSSWKDAEPFFTVTDDDGQLAGTGWLAGTPEGLHLKMIVKDTNLVRSTRSTPWSGDGIELCLDAKGDGTQGADEDATGFYGPDDVKFMMTLTEEGAWAVIAGAKDFHQRGPLDEDTYSVEWREDEKEIHYELTLPWSLLEVTPGLYPTLGIAVQINDLNEGMEQKRVAKWGDGTFGPFRPGLFNKVSVGAPPGEYLQFLPDQQVIWNPKNPATARFAVSTDKPYVVQIMAGEEPIRFEQPATNGLQRFQLEFFAGFPTPPQIPVTVEFQRAGIEPLKQEFLLEFPDATYDALMARLDELIPTAEAEHPLFLRHLQSVQAMVRGEWARMGLYRASEPLTSEDSFRHIQAILNGLNNDAGEWETYRSGQREMIMGFLSSRDGTLQHYRLALPKNWDPEKEYPLFFELHGAGDDNPLAGPGKHLAVPTDDKPLPRTFPSVYGAGYFCHPFGRGNLGYAGIAEIDVWEAYDDMHKLFKIDPDRRYLFGFSMGGAGTYSLGSRTPDRWAALAIMAGGLWREKPGHDLARNIAHLPVFLSCGEEDSLFRFLDIMKSELNKYGNEPEVWVIEGLGHNYRGDIQERVTKWLEQHTRKQPQTFSYVAITDDHLGAWGVEMIRDLTISGMPSFTCELQENNEVHITSTGTPGLSVDTTDEGLGLADDGEGEVVIVWNGEETYRGPSGKSIKLGLERAPSFRD